MNIMIMIILKCYSISPYDFTHEQVYRNNKKLLIRSLPVILIKNMLRTKTNES